MTVYLISGLGADHRAFQNLILPSTWQTIHLPWLPISPKETIGSYAEKFARQISHSTPYAIVGLSFGGMLAIEMQPYINPKKTFIISSIKNSDQLPMMMKFVALLKIHRLVPKNLLNKVYPFTNWYFGITTTKEKILLKSIIHNTSPDFLKWAINQIVNWKHNKEHTNIIQIHGENDHIFPLSSNEVYHQIQAGGHFMIFNKATEISDIIINSLTL